MAIGRSTASPRIFSRLAEFRNNGRPNSDTFALLTLLAMFPNLTEG
jgi:hypothetical protein